MLQKYEVMMVNEMIFKIYTTKDSTAMRREILEQLKLIIPYDYSSFYLAANNGVNLMRDPVGVGIADFELQRYIEQYEQDDYLRFLFMNGKSGIYNEKDVFEDSFREEQRYYKELYKPKGIHFSIQFSIAVNGKFLGVICLYRRPDALDFSEREMFILSLLLPHLETVLHREVSLTKAGKGNIISDEADGTFDAYDYMKKYSLTPREVEILKQLMEGLTSEEIDDNLSISDHTLKKHMNNLYKKLGITHRWELIKFK